MSSPEAYKLFDLNQYIRRVISLNFDHPIWVEAEISQAGFSRGNWYIDLIQKEEESIIAQCQAALWGNMYYFIKKKIAIPLEDILQAGLAVKLKVNVDFHERYGMKLIIEDIDPSFTLGKLAIQKEIIIKKLKDQNLIDRNKLLIMPEVVKRIAVISSSTAAGWKDFTTHLTANAFGYQYRIELFEAAMQGSATERDILRALESIEMRINEFDVVAIMRGGGGKTDLAVFDNYPVAARISNFKLPVIVGIGHEIDSSVLDIVAHTSVKTPTALAHFLIERTQHFECRLMDLRERLLFLVRQTLARSSQQIVSVSRSLEKAVSMRIWASEGELKRLEQSISFEVTKKFDASRRQLDTFQQILQILDPDQVLSRGYTITRQNGKVVSRSKNVNKELGLETIFLDGIIQSEPK